MTYRLDLLPMAIRLKTKRFIFEGRAATVLYNFLTSLNDKRKFLLPANVCPVVPLTFLKAKVPFEFVDISSTNLCMDQTQTLAILKSNADPYSGVFFVRTYGFGGNFEPFFRNIKRIDEKLIVIDDRCLSVPEIEPRHAAFSDLILYSTGYSKVVDLGWGGYGLLEDRHEYKRTSLAFKQDYLTAIERSYKKSIYNRQPFVYRDTDWLTTKKPECSFDEYLRQIESVLSDSIVNKNNINRIYSSKIPIEIQLRKGFQDWRFNIRVTNKERLLENLFAAGLFASSHYASLDGLFSAGRSPTAEKVHSEVVNLFNDSHYNVEMAYRTADIVIEHVSKQGLSQQGKYRGQKH